MQTTFSFPNLYYSKARKGSSLILAVIFMVVLLGFLGMSIYLGLNAFIQGELQKAVSTAALVGASAYYDSSANGACAGSGIAPQACFANAQLAATQTYNHIVEKSPVLNAQQSYFQTSPPTISSGGDPDSIQVTASAQIPTPFLSLIGINSFDIQGIGKAKYMKYVLSQISFNPFQGSNVKEIQLQHPLVDGPGPDLFIQSASPWHGYTVEACSGNVCYDISRAARFSNSQQGAVFERNYNNIIRRILYGNVYIDLAQTGSTSSDQYVRKASKLRIIDDGIPDILASNGDRAFELVPTPTVLQKIEIYHYSALCPPPIPGQTGGNTCPSSLSSLNLQSMQ